jgi:NAD(P)H-dependent FMN reductase
MPQLSVVVGSTRPGRVGLPIAEWFAQRATAHGAFEVVLTDLAEFGLPLFDEPEHPRLRRYSQQHTRAWSVAVDAADAFVFVAPEYNHGMNAALKNALDYLHHEWQHKAVGFVSYGGVSAGTRSVAQLKQTVTVLKMIPVAAAVNVPFHTQFLDDDGRFVPNSVLEESAIAMLDEISEMDAAVEILRRGSEGETATA